MHAKKWGLRVGKTQHIAKQTIILKEFYIVGKDESIRNMLGNNEKKSISKANSMNQHTRERGGDTMLSTSTQNVILHACKCHSFVL